MNEKIEMYNKKVREAFEMLKELGINNPCECIQILHIDKISPNGYNPNKVAQKEMSLLLESIKQDGYTMPIVVIENDEKQGEYVIVDGFHRYWNMKTDKELYEKNQGYIPCSIIKGEKANIIASTIRHNKARGKHNVVSDSNCINLMLESMSDEEVCKSLGMSIEDFNRYKLFLSPEQTLKNFQYSQSYKTFFEVVAEIEREGVIRCLTHEQK